MKELFTDANFPRTAEGRVYHLGVRHGEVANRILTVGDPSRAQRVAQILDATPKPFALQSERGFLVITGTYRGTPLSIISIGMGASNMDFFVREARESVIGDMAIIRLGSCGGLLDELPVGTLTVPRSCVSVSRNYEYDFTSTESTDVMTVDSRGEEPYRISRPVEADQRLYDGLLASCESTREEESRDVIVKGGVANAACDSFYGSQGRKTSFPDHNDRLIDTLMEKVPGVATFEMESHHLYHLASVYQPPKRTTPDPTRKKASSSNEPAILSSAPGVVSIVGSHGPAALSSVPTLLSETAVTGGISASSVHIIFAQRNSREMIKPEVVAAREQWAGKACMEALKAYELQTTHPDDNSVWAMKE